MRTLSAATASALALMLPAVAPAGAGPQAARTAGGDRIGTAAALAEATFPEAAHALLARADDHADALAGAGLAGALRAPVLLTGHDRLPDPTVAALDRLGVHRVLLLGGEAAISRRVEVELVERGFTVERVAGADRYATAAVAAERAATAPVPRVFVVSGEAFADALVAGPVAYALAAPLLLTRPDALPGTTAEALDRLAPTEAIVLGGAAAVSQAVEDAIAARGIGITRIAGADRVDTAARFADAAVAHLGFDAAHVLLARGDDFADALAAAPRGGELRAPLLLSPTPRVLGAATERWLAAACEAVGLVEAVGGEAAVSPAALARALTAVDRCGLALRTFSYATGVRGAVHADFDEFRRVVEATLNDQRGWALDGDVAFVEVADAPDLTVWLASPQAVAAAAPVCHQSWSCRVGDHVLVNDMRWRESTTTYRGEGRTLGEYRSYVLNHEVGHWLGFGHAGCPGPGRPAPVMQQQSIRLDGCASNVWPLEAERDAVRRRHLGG